MKTLTALTIGLLILVPQSASALTITDGYVFVPNDFHRVADFGGANFSVVAWDEWQGPVTRAFDVAPFTISVGLSQSPVTFLAVGSETCIPTSPFPGPDPSCLGHITLTSPGLAMPTDWPTTTLFAASVPFSATGSLVVGGNRYDITGEGTVTGLRCLDLASCGIRTDHPTLRTSATLTYIFTVAEPATLLLPATFAFTIVGMAIVHRRAAGNR